MSYEVKIADLIIGAVGALMTTALVIALLIWAVETSESAHDDLTRSGDMLKKRNRNAENPP
jgi:hypothetical protein